MKEFEVRAQFNKPVSPSADLTTPPVVPTLDVRGNIFMDQGKSERPPIKSSSIQETPPIESPKWASPDLENIKTPILKEFAADLKAKLEINPLNKWSDADLEDAYVKLLTERQRLAMGHAEGFEREGIASEAQQVGWGMLAELQDRGADIGKLILRATNSHLQPEPLSMGPGTMAAGGPRPSAIDISGIGDAGIQAIGERYNNNLASLGVSSDRLTDIHDQVAAMTVTLGQEADRDMLLQKINEKIANTRADERTAMEERRRETSSLYISQPAIEAIARDPIAWLNSQFDVIYRIAAEGQAFDSPIVNSILQQASEAMRILKEKAAVEADTGNTGEADRLNKSLQEFEKLQIIRLNLLKMRSAIGYRSIEQIQQESYNLQVHGLFTGMSFEDGKVGAMFNRFDELLENERLKAERNHVTPEMQAKLQDKLIKEQIDMAGRGIGIFFSAEKNQAEMEGEIKRAIGTAYDVFVSSQRQAVITARGKHLQGADAYFSDAVGGPLNVYNLEDLLTAKFGLYTEDERKYLDETKIDMADEDLKTRGKSTWSMSREDKIELGTRLFRDLFLVPDFFSSSWRVQGILKSIESRFENAQDFGLFLRLKDPRIGEGRERVRARAQIWDKIAGYRPEEIIRLFKERDNGQLEGLYAQLEGVDDYLRLTDEEKEHNRLINKNDEEHPDMGKITAYTKFKDKYGAAIRMLREEYFRKEIDVLDDEGNPAGKKKWAPEQINLATLTDEQKASFLKIMGSEEAVSDAVGIFAAMQKYITDNKMIDQLMTSTKFEDIYNRTLTVDDALLDRLELVSDEEKERGIVPLSKMFGTDKGGDAYVRIWNDTANGMKAGQSLVGFMKNVEHDEENDKAARAFGDAVSQYNGEPGRAKCIRFTRGTFLIASLQDLMSDSLGISKGIFRRPISKIERIFGPQATPISRDTARAKADEINTLMNGDPTLWKGLEKKLQLGLLPQSARRGMSFFIFLLTALFSEAYEISGAKGAAGRK
ncbi:MAG: hypothetical protein AAB521_01830 [Patescibacteria group bacterium]